MSIPVSLLRVRVNWADYTIEKRKGKDKLEKRFDFQGSSML